MERNAEGAGCRCAPAAGRASSGRPAQSAHAAAGVLCPCTASRKSQTLPMSIMHQDGMRKDETCDTLPMLDAGMCMKCTAQTRHRGCLRNSTQDILQGAKRWCLPLFTGMQGVWTVGCCQAVPSAGGAHLPSSVSSSRPSRSPLENNKMTCCCLTTFEPL